MSSAKFQLVCKKVLGVIDSFPQSKIGIPYLTLKDGRKCFFDVFIKKYGIDGGNTKYKENDILRRIRLIEFFEIIMQTYPTQNTDSEKEIIESKFHRIVIGKLFVRNNVRLVLISFFNHT